MEAPVPASALIHSATLVSAGVFLILRLYNFFELTSIVSLLVPFIGAFTAFFGGLSAMFQTDVKRILAYSTISHCGYLMVAATVCHPDITLIYLFVHGFFKALTFLCVGNVIRIANNYQDIRYMGQFYRLLPFECCVSF
jgi:NADH-quinone oxidoreductase subunit L